MTFAVTAGGGTVTGGAATTDANGLATINGWTLGVAAGTNAVTATTSGLSPVTFTATGAAGPAARLGVVTAPSAAPLDRVVFAAQPVIQLQDANGNAAAQSGVTVTVAVSAGGGTLAGTASAISDATGRAAFTTLQLNGTVGDRTLTFTSGALTSATSVVSLKAGAAATITANGGTNQSAVAGSAVTTTPSVKVMDGDANPVSGVSVAFAVASGAGSITGATSTTDSSGVATVGSWTLGAVVGANTIKASAPGVTGSPVTITATGTAGTASKISVITAPSATSADRASFTVQPIVQVQDALGNAITTSTASVTASITTGGGTLNGTVTRAAASGIATFTDLAIAGVNGARTLTFSAAGLTSATTSVTVVAGPAASIAINAGNGQTATSGSAIVTAPSVKVTDLDGNAVSGTVAAFTVATGGGSATGTSATSDSSGIATVGSWTLGSVAGPNTLTAAVTGLTGSPLTFTATGTTGAAASIAISAGNAQSAVLGSAVTTNPAVIVKDAQGNVVSGVTVTFAIGSGGGAVAGATQTTNSLGVATVGSWTLGAAAGANTLTATSTGLTGSPATFTATGTAAGIVATAVSANTGAGQTAVAGTAVSTAPSVKVVDAVGNPVAGFAVTFTVASGGGSLTGGTQTTNVSGIATVGSWTLGTTAGSNVLSAAAASLTGSPVTFSATGSAGAAAKLVFATQPTTLVAGAGGTFTVSVADINGNINTTAANPVTLAIATGTGAAGAALSGTLTVSAVNGVATFNGISVDKAGAGYQLVAAASGLASGTSSAFTITSIAGAAKLAFSGTVSTTVAGTPIAPSVTVLVQDAAGSTVTTASNSVTLAISAIGGTTGATLRGTKAVSAINGVATFPGLSIDSVGTAYTLTATATGLTSTTNAAFNVTVAPPVKLGFTVQPASVASGSSVSPSVKVAVQDSLGNTNTATSVSITIAIAAGTGTNNATLGGTKVVTTTGGVATFSSLSVDSAGTGYKLSATATGLTSATSTTVTVTPGVATKLAFAVQPSSVTAGVAVAPAIQVSIRDAAGNTVTSANTAVTIAMGANPSAGTLGGTKTINAVSGIATFSDLSIDKVGVNYTVTAAATGLTGATSTPFTVSSGVAAKVVFSVQPANALVGVVMSPSVKATIQDAAGNTVTTATNTVVLSFVANPGSAVLGGTLTQVAVAGIATFANLTVNAPGVGYTLGAASLGLSGATSGTFNAVGVATQVAFLTPPSNVIANGVFTPAVQVVLRDAAGNTVTSPGATVTMAIANNAGGASLGGSVTAVSSSGIATFSTLKLSKAGTAYTLAASAPGLTGATSPAFDVAAFGTATKLAYTVTPSNVAVGAVISPPIQIAVEDALNNVVTTSAAPVTVVFGANPGAGTLGGTTTINAVNGVATFSTLTVSAAGTSYNLTAQSTGLSSATSPTFNVVDPAAAIALAFTAQPSAVTAGSIVSPSVLVEVRNSSNALVNSANNPITMSIASGPAGAVLGGTLNVTALNGVATFNSLSLTKAGTYTLLASGAGLNGGTSAPFVITAAAAKQLAITAEPGGTTAGHVINSPLVVQVQDQYGNLVTSASNPVSLTSAYCGANIPLLGSTQGFLAGTTTMSAVGGVATFSDLRPRLACTSGNPYIRASATSLSSDMGWSTSQSASPVTPSPVSQLGWTNTVAAYAGTPIANVDFRAGPVYFADSIGNTASPGASVITLSFGSNPTGATLNGTTAGIADASGSFDFRSLSITKGGNYTLTASSPGVLSTTSTALTVAPFGTAAQLEFLVQPSSAAPGAAIAPPIQVRVLDAYGNAVTNSTATIAIAVGANPGGSAIGGTLSVNAINGVATFNNITLSNTGTNYTLVASATGLGTNTSAPFPIGP